MDSQVAARLTKLDEVLKQTGSDYENRERLRGDVSTLLRSCHTLQPRSGSFSNGGRSVDLFYLYGVLPIKYKGVEYHVPVTFYFDGPYPKQPPRCFVTVTPGIALKAGHPHVDDGGMIHMPYLSSWRERSSTLTEMVASITSAFSAAPPVYSTGKPAAASSGGHVDTGRPYVGSSQPWTAQGHSSGRLQDHSSGRLSVGDARPTSRKEALMQSATEALRERWSSVVGPAVSELNEQLDLQRRLQADNLEELGDFGELDEQQALDCLAEELALDELLVGLDELLAAHKIKLEDFIREVRDVTRRQFMCRAQRLKSASVAAAAAPLPEAADTVRNVPPAGQQALRASGPGASGLADRSAAGGRRL